MLSGFPNMSSATTSLLSTYTTFAALAVLVRTVINEVQSVCNQIIPKALQEKIMSKLFTRGLSFSNTCTLIINESSNGAGLQEMNQVFEAAQVYLPTRITSSVSQMIVSKGPRERHLSVSIHEGEEVMDTASDGLVVKWKLFSKENKRTQFEYRGYELSFDKKHKDKVLNSYIPSVLEQAKEIEDARKDVKLYALGSNCARGSVYLRHPSTFETLAMDPEVKQGLIDDLTRFKNRRSLYKRVGKTWKRGYLLYGPPGTGKSSLIAAMANFLKFDIYDLELATLRNNDSLRNLLVSSKNRSILVIEDIDCSIDLENREDHDEYGSNPKANKNQITLSGLLNFIDGLWSSCGDERIIVFTTNRKDKLDPALIRPGRMDMHIHMSYCTFSGFKILASNYHGIEFHPKFAEMERLIGSVEATPAEIAEELMRSEHVDVAMDNVLKLLSSKKRRRDDHILGKNGEGKEEEKGEKH